MKTYNTPSATIVVERLGWNSTVVAVSTASCRRGVEFRFDRSGKRAAAWLAERDLTGLVHPGMTWDELEAAVRRPVATPVEPALRMRPVAEDIASDVAGQVERLVAERVESILEDHYRWVLADKGRRQALARALRDADALERAERIRQASR